MSKNFEIKLKTPIDYSAVNFKNKDYVYGYKVKEYHSDGVEMHITTRSEIDDSSVEEVLKQLAKDFLEEVSKEKICNAYDDYDIKIEYACNFSDPTIWDTYCDTALFHYTFTEEIDDLVIKHMELVLTDSKAEHEEGRPDCIVKDLEAPLHFNYIERARSNNKKFDCSSGNVEVIDRYKINEEYAIKSLLELSKNLIIELEEQYTAESGDEKLDVVYNCNYDSPLVYDIFCNKAMFNIFSIEKTEDKIINHIQLVLCKDEQYKEEYDDYLLKTF